MLVAAAVDLFRARPLHWVQTQRGAWVLALGQGMLRLQPAAEGTWAVVHVPRGQPHHTVRRGLPLDYALGVAEDYARRPQAAALHASDDAGLSGLCHEGRWACAVDSAASASLSRVRQRAIEAATITTAPPVR